MEKQARISAKKAPLAYKYCVNYMLAEDIWRGHCRGKAEGKFYAEGQEGEKQGYEEGQEEGIKVEVEQSKDFGTLVPLVTTEEGEIARGSEEA